MKLAKLFLDRNNNTHKGDYGHVFILAGSTGLIGAAVLAARACLVSGCGLVTVGIPKSLNPILEVKLTEVMTLPLAETVKGTFALGAFSEANNFINENVDVVIIGPGISREPQTQELARRLLLNTKKTTVLDADGINAICNHLDILKMARFPLIITPHPGEMARLVNSTTGTVQKKRLNLALKFANKYNIYVVLKGYRTLVASPKGKIYVNETGNPGMATAGSGDVLTGMIAGILAQGVKAFEAGKIAVNLHGVAGDIAADKKCQAGIIASDILENIPEAMKVMYSS